MYIFRRFISLESIKQVNNNMTLIMLSRHPLTRLISAYVDKYEDIPIPTVRKDMGYR